MAPKIKVSYAEIVEATLAIVRDEGFDAVNARSIAARLNCSTQPVMRTFGTINEVKAAAYRRAENIYNKAMFDATKNSSEGFLAMGLAYINFAKTEKNLFRLLFMSNAFDDGSVADIAGTTHGDKAVISMISEMTKLDKQKSMELFSGIWFTVHGIASLVATNSCDISDADIRKVLTQAFDGFVYSIGKEGHGAQ